MSAPTERTIEIDRHYQRDRLMDIIGHPPGWILRSGTILIALITSLLFCLAWFIRYPDIIDAPVVITSDHPPVEVYTNHAGIIDSIYVQDGDRVDAGQILFHMNNAARPYDVNLWKNWLESTIRATSPDSFLFAPPLLFSLGELHPSYTGVSQKYHEWYRWLVDQSVTEKIRANRREIETIKQLMVSLQQQIDIYDQEISLQRKSLDRDESLFNDRVISAAEYEKAEASYLGAIRQKESIATGMLSHRMRMNQLESALLDQQINYGNQLLALFITLQTLSREALAYIGKWEDQYIVRSVVSGSLSIPEQILPHAYITTGEPLMAVLPKERNSSVYAVARVASKGLGKIDVGDRVIIRLDAWPYKQFGTLTSKVHQISRLPIPGIKESITYEIRMTFSKPILTTTGATLPLKPQEPGTARIITRNRRIFERLFEPLLQLANINHKAI